MQVKRIICPSCGVVLDVTNSKNESVKQITCPKCKVGLKVKFLPEQGIKKAEDHIYNITSIRPSYKLGKTRLVDGVQTKTILCPICKAVLDVRNSSNEEQKQIACPRCSSILQVKFSIK